MRVIQTGRVTLEPQTEPGELLMLREIKRA